MLDFITEWRRKYVVGRIVRRGRCIDKLRAELAYVDDSYDRTVVDSAYLNSIIEHAEAAQSRDLQFIRDTA